LADPQHRIPRAVEHLPERHHIPGLALDDGLILARHELVPVAEELGLAVLLEDVRHLGPRGENEAQPALEEDALHDSDHLQRVSGEIEEGVRVGEAVVGEERVEPEVAGVVSLVWVSALRARGWVETHHL
jgi:hypothetical protein